MKEMITKEIKQIEEFLTSSLFLESKMYVNKLIIKYKSEYDLYNFNNCNREIVSLKDELEYMIDFLYSLV